MTCASIPGPQARSGERSTARGGGGPQPAFAPCPNARPEARNHPPGDSLPPSRRRLNRSGWTSCGPSQPRRGSTRQRFSKRRRGLKPPGPTRPPRTVPSSTTSSECRSIDSRVSPSEGRIGSNSWNGRCKQHPDLGRPGESMPLGAETGDGGSLVQDRICRVAGRAGGAENRAGTPRPESPRASFVDDVLVTGAASCRRLRSC